MGEWAAPLAWSLPLQAHTASCRPAAVTMEAPEHVPPEHVDRCALGPCAGRLIGWCHCRSPSEASRPSRAPDTPTLRSGEHCMCTHCAAPLQWWAAQQASERPRWLAPLAACALALRADTSLMPLPLQRRGGVPVGGGEQRGGGHQDRRRGWCPPGCSSHAHGAAAAAGCSACTWGCCHCRLLRLRKRLLPLPAAALAQGAAAGCRLLRCAAARAHGCMMATRLMPADWQLRPRSFHAACPIFPLSWRCFQTDWPFPLLLPSAKQDYEYGEEQEEEEHSDAEEHYGDAQSHGAAPPAASMLRPLPAAAAHARSAPAGCDRGNGSRRWLRQHCSWRPCPAMHGPAAAHGRAARCRAACLLVSHARPRSPSSALPQATASRPPPRQRPAAACRLTSVPSSAAPPPLPTPARQRPRSRPRRTRTRLPLAWPRRRWPTR